ATDRIGYPSTPSFLSVDAPTKRIFLVQQQCRFTVHKGSARDGGNDGLTVALVAAGEGTANNTLLHPEFALFEFAVSGQARQLRTGPRAARRSVVRFTGTEHKVARMSAGRLGWAEQFNVVYFGKTLRVHRLADTPRIVRQPFDIG